MDNFDLKKYLIETKATVNSRLIKEDEEPGRAPQSNQDQQSREKQMPNKYFVITEGEDAVIDNIAVVESGLDLRGFCEEYRRENSTRGSELVVEILEGEKVQEVGFVHINENDRSFIFKYDRNLESDIRDCIWMSDVEGLIGFDYSWR